MLVIIVLGREQIFCFDVSVDIVRAVCTHHIRK